jgi:hypothetical protein
VSTASVSETPRSPGRAALGWLAALAALGYTALCHHGIGEPAGGIARHWWQPRGFMHSWVWLGEINDLDTSGVDVAVLALPAIAIAALVFWGTRSAFARALALTGVAGAPLFAFFGLYASGPWEFFHWRGSLVIALTAATVGLAAAAPLFARSFLSGSWRVASLLYFPVALGCIALMRHATGWSANMRFNISPWPALPIFALDIVAYLLCGFFIALAICVASARDARGGLIGLVAGALVLSSWVALRYGAGPSVVLPPLAVFVVAAGLAIFTTSQSTRTAYAAQLALGAALIALPILSGTALASGDYAHNRYVRAQVIIDALDSYFHREEIYPETLADLIATGDIDTVPRPRVGFDAVYRLGFLEPIEFEYESMGSSYILEFVSIEWIQCAFNPPWIDDEEELDPEDADLALGVWSCPEGQPELF